MPSPAILQLETNPSWVVEFPCLGDRFGCEVAWRGETGKLTRLLTSVEGQSGQPIQPSPPLQQFHLQTIDNRPVAFGVGMADGLHYSCSVSLAGAEGHDLLFEYAVNRLGEDRERWPTNTWQLAPETRLTEVQSSLACAHSQTLRTANGMRFDVLLRGCTWQPYPAESSAEKFKQLFTTVDPVAVRATPVIWVMRLYSPAA